MKTKPNHNFLEWLAVKTQLNQLKAKELALRKAVVSSFAVETVPGIYSVVNENIKFTATIHCNYKVSHDDLNPIWATLSGEERDCIDYKPSVKVAAFKALSPESSLARVVVETPATPALTFKLMEEKK